MAAGAERCAHSWPRTSCTPPRRRRSASTRRSAWCRAPTPTSWTSSAQVGEGRRALLGPFRRSVAAARRRARPAGCYKITTVFSHAQTVVLCVGCSTVLCQPTGGKARLTEGCSFRRKQH
uniref:Ribosomal protein S27 n=1 Tax=Gallus gallus TaxID=9031 RepID=A0A8V1ABI8_CHICK